MPSHGRYERPPNRFNSEIKIHNVRQSDEGDYICRAENTQGSQQTVIRLEVQGSSLSLSSSSSSSSSSSPSSSTVAYLPLGHLGNAPTPLNCEKIVATRCQLLRLNAPNSISVGALPQTPLGKLTDPLAGFKGNWLCFSVIQTSTHLNTHCL